LAALSGTSVLPQDMTADTSSMDRITPAASFGTNDAVSALVVPCSSCKNTKKVAFEAKTGALHDSHKINA
jgi:hypothetical protein